MQKNILSFQEGCDLLGLKPGYVYKLTATGVLPFSKPNGKKIYFERHKLEEWLLSNPSPGRVEREKAAATYVTAKPDRL